MAPRAKVLPGRLTGKVVDWKGTYGWIQPASAVNHPQARKNGGKLYLSQEDVEAELLGVGAAVTFFVYADNKGLGAMNVRPGLQKSNAVQEAIAKMKAASTQNVASKPAVTAATSTNGPNIRKSNAVQQALLKMRAETAQGAVKTPAAKADPAPKGSVGGTAGATSGPNIRKSNAVQFAKMKMGQLPGLDLPTPATPGKANPKAGVAPKQTAVVTTAEGRTKVDNQKVTGTVTDWRGKFGWIVADKPISHPMADKNGGKIYFAQEDVEEELEGVGAAVGFFLYADKKGLGAMDVRPASAAAKTPFGQKAGAPATPKAAAKKAAAKATGKASAKATPKASALGVKNSAVEKQAQKQKAGAGGAEKPKLPRTRVTNEEPVQGEITFFKKSFGWVKLLEPVDGVDEEKAQKIYLHKDDIAEGTSKEIGTVVQFHVYEDSSGFGAEECSEL